MTASTATLPAGTIGVLSETENCLDTIYVCEDHDRRALFLNGALIHVIGRDTCRKAPTKAPKITSLERLRSAALDLGFLVDVDSSRVRPKGSGRWGADIDGVVLRIDNGLDQGFYQGGEIVVVEFDADGRYLRANGYPFSDGSLADVLRLLPDYAPDAVRGALAARDAERVARYEREVEEARQALQEADLARLQAQADVARVLRAEGLSEGQIASVLTSLQTPGGTLPALAGADGNARNLAERLGIAERNLSEVRNGRSW